MTERKKNSKNIQTPEHKRARLIKTNDEHKKRQTREIERERKVEEDGKNRQRAKSNNNTTNMMF